MPIEPKKLTPILVVEAIEPCLPFWTALGFEKANAVPDGDRLGFASVQLGPVEVMLQTEASVQKDLCRTGQPPQPRGTTYLYMEVADLESVIPLLGKAPVVTARRKTFYGADEIYVREPGGHVVGFAAFGK